MNDNSDKNATSILLIQGFVVNIGKTGQTKVVCPTSGSFDVKWRKNVMPKIAKGQYITILGRLVTYDLGRSFLVVGAVLMPPKSLNVIKKFIKHVKGEEK